MDLEIHQLSSGSRRQLKMALAELIVGLGPCINYIRVHYSILLRTTVPYLYRTSKLGGYILKSYSFLSIDQCISFPWSLHVLFAMSSKNNLVLNCSNERDKKLSYVIFLVWWSYAYVMTTWKTEQNRLAESFSFLLWLDKRYTWEMLPVSRLIRSSLVLSTLFKW